MKGKEGFSTWFRMMSSFQPHFSMPTLTFPSLVEPPTTQEGVNSREVVCTQFSSKLGMPYIL
jgi:hypothetical protein